MGLYTFEINCGSIQKMFALEDFICVCRGCCSIFRNTSFGSKYMPKDKNKSIDFSWLHWQLITPMRPPYWKLFLYPGKSVEIFPVFKSVFMMIVIYINSYRSAINLTNWWCHDNPLRMSLWLLYNDHVKSYIKMLKISLHALGFFSFQGFQMIPALQIKNCWKFSPLHVELNLCKLPNGSTVFLTLPPLKCPRCRKVLQQHLQLVLHAYVSTLQPGTSNDLCGWHNIFYLGD